MKRILFCLCTLGMAAVATAQTGETYFLSQPSLSPDGQTVVFSFEGDLWKASVAGGTAYRLTAMQGYETGARISPDGAWVAFTGSQYGNADVFTMPINGGEIRQLTHHSGADAVASWAWDSKNIYLTSSRAGQVSGFKVGLEGGTPQRVFGDYFFQYDHNLFENPKTGEIFFNDTWESSNQVQRKRYKGPFNPDIQSYNPATKKYQRYTTWEGKDFGATVDRNGAVYFISDEANGQYNLYTLTGNKKTPLTSFNTSIKAASVAANGGKVVFEKDYQLWLYDAATKKSGKLDIAIYRNNILQKEKDFDVKGAITAFDVSPDGKKLAFTSRGELFVSDIDGKFVMQVPKGNAERAKEVKWMADNRTLLYNQTAGGYLNWYTISASGTGAPKQLTAARKNVRAISFNKKRTMAVYLSGRDEVRLIDLKTLTDKPLLKEEIWGLDETTPRFSPNDEHIVFTAYRNFEKDVFVHDIKKNKTVNLTNTAITEDGPIWSGDSKYIYFHSARLKPAYPMGISDARIYRLPLEKLDEPYRIDKFNEMFKEEVKDTTKKDTAAKVAPMAPVATNVVSIDMDNIMERLELVGPSFGTQALQMVYGKGDKTTVLYSSNHGEGRFALWKTALEPFETIKMEKIAGTDGAGGFEIVEVSDKLYALFNGNITKLNLDGNKADPISIGYTFRRNLSDEFAQIFEEMWADVEENFYDGDFHGINWAGMKSQYAKYVPYINTRADLRTLMNDLLGELNSSHQGFNTAGADETISLQNRTMETGIVFDNANPYRVSHTVKRSPVDRKSVDIRKGDILIKVADRTVDPKMDRNYYFSRPSLDRELKLTFSRNGQPYDVKLHPQASMFNNYYDEWIDANQKRVDDRSKNRVAYTHMKNMGQPELEAFLIDMTKELNNKDALILDLRYNTGGNVHDDVLRFLSQRSYLQWRYREGQLTKQSNFAPSDKPIILLINEQSLSDAEMTAEGFKALKLGKIVGNETYRWIIFTSGMSLVDGSQVRMPSWGCYTLDGKDLEMSGVKPDITVINTFEDKISGRDPQLDRAIEEALKGIK